MKTRLLAAALLCAFAPLAVQAPAYAQQADDPSVKAARARFQEGVAFFDKGDFENARAAFLQAYALRKHPAVLINLAQSSLRSGRALEAARYFHQYLHDSSGLTPAQRTDAEKGLTEARQKLGRIDVSAPTGAAISVDGEAAGTAPLSDAVDVDPGAHKVKAGNDEQTISVAVGQRVPARFGANSPAPAPAPTPVPTPLPLPPPPSPTPTTPSEPPPPPPADTATSGAAPVGTDSGVPKKSLLSRPENMVPVYIGAGVLGAGAAVALVVGVIFKSSAQNNADTVAAAIKGHPGSRAGICTSTNKNDVNTFGAACSKLADDNNQVDTDATVGNIGLAVGLAGAAFAVGWYLFAPKKQTDPAKAWIAPPISPIVGKDVNGLSFTRSF